MDGLCSSKVELRAALHTDFTVLAISIHQDDFIASANRSFDQYGCVNSSLAIMVPGYTAHDVRVLSSSSRIQCDHLAPGITLENRDGKLAADLHGRADEFVFSEAVLGREIHINVSAESALVYGDSDFIAEFAGGPNSENGNGTAISHRPVRANQAEYMPGVEALAEAANESRVADRQSIARRSVDIDRRICRIWIYRCYPGHHGLRVSEVGRQAHWRRP